MTATCRDDRGSATVEFAMILPAVVAMMGVVMGGLAWAQGSLRVQAAASTGARVAIVEGDSAAIAAARRVAGGASPVQVAVSRVDGWVTVRVEIPARGLVPASRASAVAKDQP
jgi:Flp pilus assembly protein TadG